MRTIFLLTENMQCRRELLGTIHENNNVTHVT